jgi:hypothetical protein
VGRAFPAPAGSNTGHGMQQRTERWLDDLRQTPVYQNALHTQDVIRLRAWTHKSMWDSDSGRLQKMNRFQNEQIIHAGLRLDHLIRNACDPMYFREFPNTNMLSAIKLFVESLEIKRQSGIMTDVTYNFMKPRINFCYDLIEGANQVLHENCYPPVSSDAFHQMVAVAGHTDEEIVFDNPFYSIGPMGAGGKAGVFANRVLGSYWE